MYRAMTRRRHSRVGTTYFSNHYFSKRLSLIRTIYFWLLAKAFETTYSKLDVAMIVLKAISECERKYIYGDSFCDQGHYNVLSSFRFTGFFHSSMWLGLESRRSGWDEHQATRSARLSRSRLLGLEMCVKQEGNHRGIQDLARYFTSQLT